MIFISYSSLDRVVADRLCAAIEATGLNCWMAPRDIQAGLEWAEQIVDAIAAAAAVVLLYSDNSNQSAQVRREVERAVHYGLKVAPIRIHDVVMSKGLAYFLGAQHWYDAIEGNLDDHLMRFARSLHTLTHVREAVGGLPAPSAVAPSKNWPQEVLISLEQRLATFVGPIASVLVRRAAQQTDDTSDLVERLASEIEDPEAKRHFLAGKRLE